MALAAGGRRRCGGRDFGRLVRDALARDAGGRKRARGRGDGEDLGRAGAGERRSAERDRRARGPAGADRRSEPELIASLALPGYVAAGYVAAGEGALAAEPRCDRLRMLMYVFGSRSRSVEAVPPG